MKILILYWTFLRKAAPLKNIGNKRKTTIHRTKDWFLDDIVVGFLYYVSSHICSLMTDWGKAWRYSEKHKYASEAVM